MLCGIAFTMSLSLGVLAFDDSALHDHTKRAVLIGFLTAVCQLSRPQWR